ncbi:MAG: S8 family peptidase, partial [Muribaculaceae bacterium]|nr:S8 family peptidase [Muribaculaceae bacterium]
MWQTATGGQSAPDAPDNEATVASFSSFGQLNDGRLLPSICAPGCRIISSVSTPYATAHPDYTAYAASVTADGRENFWDYSTGTSMASPYAAGVFALMFEANPELTPAEAIAIVESTATHPLQQKPQWGGAGMLNAYEALKKALDTTGIASITAGGDRSVEITPLSGNRYSIKTYGPALDNITVTDTNGRMLLHIAPQTDCAEIDLSPHGPAIYLITASAHGTTVTKKIAVR